MDRNQLIDDTETAFRYALDNKQSQMWTATPAIVTKVNLVLMTLECQPAIKGIVSNEDNTVSYVNLPQLVDVPICFPSAGGFSLTLPIKLGDEVLVIFASRCIDAWWQSGGIAQPMELRMHDLSDGFAIPGPRSLPKALFYTVPVSSTKAQLRNDSGTLVIELDPIAGKINLTAPNGFGLIGDLEVIGEITATGEVTAKSLTAAVELSTHIHSGVSTGTSDTGAPV